jgi:hypothetical protein
MRTDGTPLEASNTTRTVQLGDAQRDPDRQAPTAPPSLRNPGEKLPQDDDKTQAGRVGVMRPVQFPKSTQDEGAAQPAATQPSGPAQPATPASSDGSQPKPAATPQPAPADQPATPQSKPADQVQENLLAVSGQD